MGACRFLRMGAVECAESARRGRDIEVWCADCHADALDAITKRCEAAETAIGSAYEAADKPDGHANWQDLWSALEEVTEILGAALESNDGGGR